jgi:hypothetical protein
MKVSNLVEELFAQAVALDQSGGLRNTIYAIENDVLILNYDHTVLLRFRLRKSEGTFEHPISFKANDYDSNVFEEKDEKIIFYSEKGEYQRKKICGTTDLTPEEVLELYWKYKPVGDDFQTILLSKDVLELLDPDLSHIEFSGSKGGTIRMVQRNIYSGGIIEIEKANEGFLKEEISEDFGPVAIKTDDFKALFYFQDTLKFSFPKKDKEDFIVIQGTDDNKRSIRGVIACCLYDEVIQLKEARNIDISTKLSDTKETKIMRRRN